MATQRSLLVFQLGEQLCGIPAAEVQEIVPMALLARPPGLPSLLEGFLSLRGTAVPVLRVHRLFQLPPTVPALYTPLVVLRGSAYPLALLVDRVLQILSVPHEALLPIRPGHCFNDCAEAEVELSADHRLVHVLAGRRLLLEKERQCVAELQAKAQQYLEELEAQPA